jgi:hypothetical protein
MNESTKKGTFGVESSLIRNITVFSLFFYFSHGVRLSPLGTAATVWPILPAPHDTC